MLELGDNCVSRRSGHWIQLTLGLCGGSHRGMACLQTAFLFSRTMTRALPCVELSCYSTWCSSSLSRDIAIHFGCKAIGISASEIPGIWLTICLRFPKLEFCSSLSWIVRRRHESKLYGNSVSKWVRSVFRWVCMGGRRGRRTRSPLPVSFLFRL